MTNKLLLTFDSLRWDVFEAANTPFIKGLGAWKRAYTQATYTFPAHMSFFMGKLPQTLDNTDYYDSVPIRFNGTDRKRHRNLDFWRVDNPEAPRPSYQDIKGPNLICGMRDQGHHTIGTGGVSWFNPKHPSGVYLTESFNEFAFFDGPGLASHHSARQQVEWISERIEASRKERPDRPIFLFVNFGETHSRFVYEGCPWMDEPDPYGDTALCLERQRLCFEYLDSHVAQIVEVLGLCDMVLCADHGEALGEDGLWGHGFHHPKIMEVPMLIRPSKTTPTTGAA